MTPTDLQFIKERPEYYIFEVETFERKCIICSKKFETQLLMNKFCGTECKARFFAERMGV